MLPERPIPDLPAPAHGLEESLTAAVPGPGLESRIDMNDRELTYYIDLIWIYNIARLISSEFHLVPCFEHLALESHIKSLN